MAGTRTNESHVREAIEFYDLATSLGTLWVGIGRIPRWDVGYVLGSNLDQFKNVLAPNNVLKLRIDYGPEVVITLTSSALQHVTLIADEIMAAPGFTGNVYADPNNRIRIESPTYGAGSNVTISPDGGGCVGLGLVDGQQGDNASLDDNDPPTPEKFSAVVKSSQHTDYTVIPNSRDGRKRGATGIGVGSACAAAGVIYIRQFGVDIPVSLPDILSQGTGAATAAYLQSRIRDAAIYSPLGIGDLPTTIGVTVTYVPDPAPPNGYYRIGQLCDTAGLQIFDDPSAPIPAKIAETLLIRTGDLTLLTPTAQPGNAFMLVSIDGGTAEWIDMSIKAGVPPVESGGVITDIEAAARINEGLPASLAVSTATSDHYVEIETTSSGRNSSIEFYALTGGHAYTLMGYSVGKTYGSDGSYLTYWGGADFFKEVLGYKLADHVEIVEPGDPTCAVIRGGNAGKYFDVSVTGSTAIGIKVDGVPFSITFPAVSQFPLYDPLAANDVLRVINAIVPGLADRDEARDILVLTSPTPGSGGSLEITVGNTALGLVAGPAVTGLDRGSIEFRGGYWRIVAKADAYTREARWVYLTAEIAYDNLAVREYVGGVGNQPVLIHQIGIITNLTVSPPGAPGPYIGGGAGFGKTLDTVTDPGKLEVLDSRTPISRNADQTEIISMVIEF